MFDFDLKKMLFKVGPQEHSKDRLKKILAEHPEIKFVSLTGVDMGNHNTDEKIPVDLFLSNYESILKNGIQTDGSSVALPVITDLSNARVDIIPDEKVNWYISHNWSNIDYKTGLPTATLRIPSYLRHNGDKMVCSRTFLHRSLEHIKQGIECGIKEHPYVVKQIYGLQSIREIKDISFTNATELEFWVKTPDFSADKDQLHDAQELKEQYWKRVTGPVANAMEDSIEVLNHYGFEVEMGHKEAGGIRPKLDISGGFDHIMEQLEIDWKYSSPMQAADNESQVKDIVRDIFALNGLEVTFLAKPIHGVAGSGEHTHFAINAILKDGKTINLFEPSQRKEQFLSPLGYGALMGLLRNYELLNPIISPTHDALQRLKPGYEAPVCVVCSLGKNHETMSRNRTVLVGLVRDVANPKSTRFELRSPNPHSNTYLVIGATFLAMLDGIDAVLKNEKNSTDLEKSISKTYGQEDFYLETFREYRSEKNLYSEYSVAEREKLFGGQPSGVYENFKNWTILDDRLSVITATDPTLLLILQSFRAQMISKWTTESHDRYVDGTLDFLRRCLRKTEYQHNEYDNEHWCKVEALKKLIGKDDYENSSLLHRARLAVDEQDYEELSKLEREIDEAVVLLHDAYKKYLRNLL